MAQIEYLGHTLVPYGNIIGKDKETRFQRLMWRTDTLTPLLSKNKGDNWDYYKFYKIAESAKMSVDIYYHPKSDSYYVPIENGLCRIDVNAQRKYIKVSR